MKAYEAKKISIESKLMPSVYSEIRTSAAFGRMECMVSISRKNQSEVSVIIEELRINGYVVNQINNDCLKISW